MNQREALAVQMLLDWILALHTFEIDNPADHLDDVELIRTIGVLADRAHTTFGAGLTQGDAIAAAMRMLGTEPAAIPGTPTQRVRDVLLPNDVAPNAGSAT